MAPPSELFLCVLVLAVVAVRTMYFLVEYGGVMVVVWSGANLCFTTSIVYTMIVWVWLCRGIVPTPCFGLYVCTLSGYMWFGVRFVFIRGLVVVTSDCVGVYRCDM